jgi:hypothetical protein
MDRRCLIGAGVVENEMDVERDRDAGVDRVEKLAELARPLPAVKLTDHRAAPGVQGRKERRRAVPGVIVRAALHLGPAAYTTSIRTNGHFGECLRSARCHWWAVKDSNLGPAD